MARRIFLASYRIFHRGAWALRLCHGAPGAPRSCLLPAPCMHCSSPVMHRPPHSGTFLQASILTIWLTPVCSSRFRLGVISSKKLFLAFISSTSPYLPPSSWSPCTLRIISLSTSSFLPCPLCWTVGFNLGHGSCVFKSPGLMTLLHTGRTQKIIGWINEPVAGSMWKTQSLWENCHF